MHGVAREDQRIRGLLEHGREGALERTRMGHLHGVQRHTQRPCGSSEIVIPEDVPWIERVLEERHTRDGGHSLLAGPVAVSRRGPRPEVPSR